MMDLSEYLVLPFVEIEIRFGTLMLNKFDASVDKKYYQLISLGCKRVFIYRGGLFEWLLLQDIYGFSAFPTTKKILDILKYK
jgi:hypothetical protein